MVFTRLNAHATVTDLGIEREWRKVGRELGNHEWPDDDRPNSQAPAPNSPCRTRIADTGGYATLFLSQKVVDRLLFDCCSLNSYEPQKFESAAEILTELQRAQKFGCDLLLVDPPGPEINKQATEPHAVFMKKLSGH
jgi:hypothetical protein